MKKITEEEIYEERNALMRSQYIDPIEHFPEKIDQLLDALSRVCLIFITCYAHFLLICFSFI